MAWLGLIADEEGNENWSAGTRPKTRKGVGELANCYRAGSGHSEGTPECLGNEAEQGGTRLS
jgi:hypothetical protein